MNSLGFPLLSIIIFLPLAGALLTLLLGRRQAAARAVGLLVALADLVLACVLWGFFNYGRAGLQFEERWAWVDPLGISYHVGVDGVGLWFLILAALIGPIAQLISWRFLDSRAESTAAPFLALLLALETGALGVFAAADLFLFFVFWEAMLVPAYFLVGHWGGEQRVRATLKFFLYTIAGSALMLVAIIALAVLHYRSTAVLTFDLPTLFNLSLPGSAQVWLFLAFLLAFAVKAPIWPLHTWLPDAYVEAPAAVTVVLAAVLSKMGLYGLIRICLPLFPGAVEAARPWIWALAIVGIVYGSLLALVQADMKRLVAYSSLAHVGLIFAGALAANPQAVQGALLQSVSHGLTVTALFFVVDSLEARRRSRLIDDLGGLWASLPLLGTLALTVMLASIGLPGLSGFPGEFTLLIGLFQESTAAAVFAALGMVLGAWYLLNLFRRVFAGPITRTENRTLPDLRRREAAVLLPLVILMFVIGILPNLVLRPTDAAVTNLLAQAEDHRVVLVEDQ